MRNKKLQETDYVVLSDVVISEDRLTVIKNYRQELRDFINKIMTGDVLPKKISGTPNNKIAENTAPK